MSTLPSSRQLLTSLLNTLTTTRTPQAATILVDEPYSGLSNPLKNISRSQRALLTSLHVLFPPPMLLQALDLLDRGLVLRVTERISSSHDDLTTHAQEEEGVVHPPQADIHLPPQGPRNSDAILSGVETGEKGKRNSVYQVRSSQPLKSRFRDAGGAAAGSMVYIIRLEAWNCSCAAFAFSAFPGTVSYGASAPWNLIDEEDDIVGVRRGGRMDEKGEEQPWEFGGLSFDGMDDGEAVPVCKHLVACLLAERWDVLRGYVKEREVGREEIGGVSAEG
jgi:hypothetical protein